MRNLFRRWKLIIPSVALLLMLAIFGSQAALADQGPENTNVNAGGMSETAHFSNSTSSVNLNGTNQTAHYTLPVDVYDNTGLGSGWHLDITATALTLQNGPYSPAPTLEQDLVSLDAPTVNGSGTYTMPSGTPIFTHLGTTFTYYSAAMQTGLGQFSLNGHVDVPVPANTYSGTYTSTVTIAIASGP